MQKIKVWNSKTLADNYVILEQMQAAIEQIAKQVSANSLADLPNSMIPTETLFEICICYELMYTKLLEHDLLTTGNIKQSSTLH